MPPADRRHVSRSGMGKRVRGVVEEVGVRASDERERADRDDDDEREDQSVLHETRASLV